MKLKEEVEEHFAVIDDVLVWHYYMNDIQEDILYAENLFRKIKNKYFMNNQSVDEVVDGLILIINNM